MLKIWTGGAAAFVLAAVTCAHAQDAVQWRVEDGGNGHWYGIVVSTTAGDMFCWDEARDDAYSQGGYLGTLTSQSESDFVCDATSVPVAPDGGMTRVWLGAFQDATTAEPSEFRWVTGEPWRWTNWSNGNPSNDGGAEDFVHFDHAGNPFWNDQYNCWTGHPNYAYLIEWSADCNSDGIVDYGQILDGTYADEDGNGVPDCCESDCPCESDCSGDLNGDDSVGPPDLGILLAVWGTDGGKISGADINEDGTVNAADLGLLVGAWGDCGCN